MSASAPTPGLALTGTTTTQPPCPIHVRRALFSEQSTIARVCGAAFWDDVLFGKLIHPLREQYPRDSDLYWLRRIQTDWWDWSHVFLVTTSVDTRTGREVVSGQAHWSRIGTREQNWMAGWGLRWWDPRKFCLFFFLSLFYKGNTDRAILFLVFLTKGVVRNTEMKGGWVEDVAQRLFVVGRAPSKPEPVYPVLAVVVSDTAQEDRYGQTRRQSSIFLPMTPISLHPFLCLFSSHLTPIS